MLKTLCSGIVKEVRLHKEDTIKFTPNILVPGVDPTRQGVLLSLALVKASFCLVGPYFTYFSFYSFLTSVYYCEMPY